MVIQQFYVSATIFYVKRLSNQVEWNRNLLWMCNELLNVSQHPGVAWFLEVRWYFQVRWVDWKQSICRFLGSHTIFCFESTQRTWRYHLISQSHATPGFRIEKIQRIRMKRFTLLDYLNALIRLLTRVSLKNAPNCQFLHSLLWRDVVYGLSLTTLLDRRNNLMR